MTALSAERQGGAKVFGTLEFTLTNGTKAYKGGLACLVIGGGTVSPGTATTARLAIGRFAQNVDATSGALPVEVELGTPIRAQWLEAHTSGTPSATSIGSVVYVQDDQTVTTTSTGRSVAGRCWGYSATKGVLVELLPSDATALTTALSAVVTPLTGETLAFDSNNANVAAADLVHGTVFTCPATDAASTITLATTEVADGTRVSFYFDGTANDFDVTVRYGTTAVVKVPASTVCTVTVVKYGSAWHAELGSTSPRVGGAFPDEVGNDVIVTAAEVIHGAVYTLPTLDDNSTVTLPTSGVTAGTIIYVGAASPGAYTVTYRYGTTAISAATTASKMHGAVLICMGSTWRAIVGVEP